MVDGADIVAPDDLLDLLGVGAVGLLERPVAVEPQGIPGRRRHAEVGRDDAAGAVTIAERRHQLCSDLTQRAGNENSSSHCDPQAIPSKKPD